MKKNPNYRNPPPDKRYRKGEGDLVLDAFVGQAPR